MTSFIAARGSGRSPSVIPAVPAASSVTTIAFIRHLFLFDDALAQRDRDRLGSSPDRETRIDVLEVCLDGALTDLQLGGDRVRGVSVGRQLQDLLLSWCESRAGLVLTVW